MSADPLPNTPPGGPIEILARMLADREGPGLAPLEAYLERFPGLEPEVRAEYARMRTGRKDPAGGTDSAVAAPAKDAHPETNRVGPYELVRELGRGGQGTVWLARDPRLGREVALKVVACSPLLGEVSRRFQREARTASQLNHPGLCPVFDMGTDDSLAWIAMRYVPGETLAAQLAGRDRSAAHVAADSRLLEDLARAVHAAHGAGVVHRDVKPSNVIVTPEGKPVLLDFGIAREESDELPLTLTGDSLGTPAYMSPEQLAGRAIDHRTDVWALGVTAYELITGQRPFESPTREGVIEAVLRREPERLSRLNPSAPRDLEVIVSTALAKEVDRRYQTAGDLAEDLERLRTGRSIRARRAGPLERLGRWSKRNPLIAGSLCATFLALVGALWVSTLSLSRTQRALDANETLLGEVTQLADAKVAGDLLAEEPELWPATPDRAADMNGWLKRARSLHGRVDTHRRALENLDQRMGSNVTAELASAADTETNAWMQDQLAEIIASIEDLIDVIPEVAARHELASSLREVTIVDRAEDWMAAAERVAADPRFRTPEGVSLHLLPQLGLVPLGADADSGLEEFAHLQSGAPPERDAETGRLKLNAETGVVLVLIPGGYTGLGCEPPSDEFPEGEPFVDPRAVAIDGPRFSVRLDPYFISKYELTSGQWERHTDRDPSLYNTLEGYEYVQPAEQISYLETEDVLAELSLVIPSEAQWEHAARGGTTTVFYTGDEPESLIGHANLADEGSRDRGGPPRWEYLPWLDDGYTTTAPVGSLLPNRFGLHDIAGNVYEWTTSPWRAISEVPPAEGDGATEYGETIARVLRGGSYAKPDIYAGSGHREGLPWHLYPPDVGVRPARPLDPVE